MQIGLERSAYSSKTPMAQTARIKRYHTRQATPSTSAIIVVSCLWKISVENQEENTRAI